MDYLEECYRALGFLPDEARHRALLVYAAYVGVQRLAREVPSRMPRDEDYVAYRQHLISTLLPNRTSTAAAGTGGEAG